MKVNKNLLIISSVMLLATGNVEAGFFSDMNAKFKNSKAIKRLKNSKIAQQVSKVLQDEISRKLKGYGITVGTSMTTVLAEVRGQYNTTHPHISEFAAKYTEVVLQIDEVKASQSKGDNLKRSALLELARLTNELVPIIKKLNDNEKTIINEEIFGAVRGSNTTDVNELVSSLHDYITDTLQSYIDSQINVPSSIRKEFESYGIENIIYNENDEEDSEDLEE